MGQLKVDLNLTQEEKEKLPILRKMVKNEPKLISPVNDQFLIKFLRARKCNCERSFEMLKRYYRAKIEYPGVYENFYPSSIKPNCQGVLKSRDVNGRLVFYLRTNDWDPSKQSVDEIMKINLIFFEQISEFVDHQLNGITGVLDCTGLNFSQVAVLRPKHAKMILAYLQDSFPVRYKEIHVLFNPFLFQVIFALIKPFMKEKMKKRLFLHGHNLDEFYKIVPKENLPEFLGGSDPLAIDELFFKEILKREKDYKDFAKYGYK